MPRYSFENGHKAIGKGFAFAWFSLVRRPGLYRVLWRDELRRQQRVL
jgi:hypothetical protein